MARSPAAAVGKRATDTLGVQRPSLNNNPLLVKSELGKPTRRCFTLPPADFTYGMPSVCVDGGAAEALSSWHMCRTHSNSRKKTPERDFISLNRLAAKSGLTTAHEQTQFRVTHDIRKREQEGEGQASRGASRIPDMTFGISTRPSTPIFDLLENRYQERWMRERRETERKQREKISKRKLHGKVYETRASLMRHYQEPLDPPPPWHMTRFSKIPPTLQTFRSEKARKTAFLHHASDSTARVGVFGHGIYQTA